MKTHLLVYMNFINNFFRQLFHGNTHLNDSFYKNLTIKIFTLTGASCFPNILFQMLPLIYVVDPTSHNPLILPLLYVLTCLMS